VTDHKPPHSYFNLGPVNVSMGNNNRVGHVGHTVNVGSQPRQLDEPTFQQMLALFPADKAIAIAHIMGDGEAQNLAYQIQQALISIGRTASVTAVMFGGRPPANVGIDPKTDPVQIIVGYNDPNGRIG
jgi:hypothetical protein